MVVIRAESPDKRGVFLYSGFDNRLGRDIPSPNRTQCSRSFPERRARCFLPGVVDVPFTVASTIFLWIRRERLLMPSLITSECRLCSFRRGNKLWKEYVSPLSYSLPTSSKAFIRVVVYNRGSVVDSRRLFGLPFLRPPLALWLRSIPKSRSFASFWR